MKQQKPPKASEEDSFKSEDETIYWPWSAKSREHTTLIAHTLDEPVFQQYEETRNKLLKMRNRFELS